MWGGFIDLLANHERFVHAFAGWQTGCRIAWNLDAMLYGEDENAIFASFLGDRTLNVTAFLTLHPQVRIGSHGSPPLAGCSDGELGGFSKV